MYLLHVFFDRWNCLNVEGRNECLLQDGLKMIYTHHAYENPTSVYLFNIIYSQFTSGVHGCERKRNLPIKRDVFFDAVLHTKVMWLL